MDDSIDVLSWGAPPYWALGTTVELPASLTEAAAVVARHVESWPGAWLLFWDPLLGAPPVEAVKDLIGGRTGDAWHAGLALGSGGLPDEHDYIHPTTPFVLDPAPDVEGSCWRLSLGAALIRTEAFTAVGGIDPAFKGATGAGLELGRRLIEHGGVVRNAPTLVTAPGALPEPLSEHDRFLFLRRTFGAKWVRYGAVRRAVATKRPLRTWRGLRAAEQTHARRPPIAPGLVERDPVAFDDQASVSVVLPTLGRYELLRPLLAQLVAQTVKPLEILVIDQNDPDKRDHELYASFADEGVRVIWQEERGQWISRNAAVQQSKGEWIAFVDDDSEVEPDFLAAHLEGLARYDAELSTGASLAVVGAPIPDNYRFFRVADQWDSGNGMCRRTLFARMGLFDQQFDRQRRGDAEFGLRVQLDGGLVVHVPQAIRIHLKAEEGGLRSYGSWDGFRHKDRSGPLPVPSMLYYTARYHTLRQQREDLFLGLVNGMVPYAVKRRAKPTQWAQFAGIELLHARSTAARVKLSRRLAAEMVAEGPEIPELVGVSRRTRGETPRRLAVFGDFPHHVDAEGRLHGLEPVVAQLERWALLFDELVLCGPLLDGPPPSGFAPYTSGKVRLDALRRAGGNDLRAKLGIVRQLPEWIWHTRRVACAADAVHIRCPCNIGMVALFSTWKAAPYRHAMYAGVWRPYPSEPRFFRYQRELLGSRWFDGPVSVYASADPEHPNLVPFSSPSYDTASWERAAPAVAATRDRIERTDASGPWRLVIVGRLTTNKNQQAAIAALQRLVDAGTDASLDLLGDGFEADALAAQAEEAGIADRVRFRGMVDHAEVLETFARSDVQLLCTRQEGYGKVLLEGMVFGVVPIFAHSPVAGEISGDGSRGVVVDPDDPDEIAAAVRSLIDDRQRWLAMVDDARADSGTLTLDSFSASVRRMLEEHWDVRFPDAPPVEA